MKGMCAALLIFAGSTCVADIAWAQDATKGAVVFKQCMICHQIGPNAKNAVGPVLTGVIGRPTGTAPGYSYSALNKAAGANGLVWNEDTIFAYLPDASAFLKKYLTDHERPTSRSASARCRSNWRTSRSART